MATFFLAALAGSGLVGLPISLRLAWSAATYSPFLSAHFVLNCRVACFFGMVIRQISLALAFSLLFLSLYLFYPLFFPLLSVGVGACEPTFCGWLQRAELMLSGAYMTITRLNAKTVPFPTPYYPIPGDMAW